MIDRFASPWAFVLLLLIPLLAWLWRRRRAPGVIFSSASLLEGVPAGWRVRARFLAPLLLLAGLAAMTVALARPQKLIGRMPRAGEGIAIEIVLDRSGSMAEEIGDEGGRAVRKIDAVKSLIRDFLLGNGEELKGRPDDLVGLVAFARFADTVAPLSRSPGIVTTLAEQTALARPRSGEDGTAIGEGLALAAARLRDMEVRNSPAAPVPAGSADSPTHATPADTPASDLTDASAVKVKSKIIVLMTDGQNNAGEIDPLQAAGLAREWGLKVYTIGIGAGSQRTARVGGGLFPDMQIPLGSGVDEETLRAIAEVTGGRYFPASDADALRQVYATIDALERTSLRSPESTLYEELFAPWAMAGAAGVLAGVFLRSTLFRSIA